METLPHITQQRNRHSSGTSSSLSSTDSSSSSGGGGRFSEIGCPMVESEVGLFPSTSKSYGSQGLNDALLRSPCGYNGGKSMVVVGDDMVSNKDVMSSRGLNHALSRTPCGYDGGKLMVVDDTMESKKFVMSSPVGVNLERSALLRTPCGYSVIDDDARESKKGVISSPMCVNLEGSGMMMNKSRDGLFLSERWAGPTYSNSPPPNCLPMPKFSMNQKRSVSLEFPLREPGSRLQKMVKSAPTSPGRDSSGRLISSLCDDDSATRSLRRILNLDISDD